MCVGGFDVGKEALGGCTEHLLVVTHGLPPKDFFENEKL